MKPILAFLVALVAGLTLITTSAWPDDDKEIPLSKVPAKVRNAAIEAVPGLQLIEAEAHRTSKGTVYELEGIADGKKYELNIAADGKVLRVTQETASAAGEPEND